MIARSVRSSKTFTLIVVCIAVFSDVFTYGVIVPVLPFALTERLGVSDEDVQKWNSILLGVLGVAIVVGSIGFGYLSDRIRTRRLPFTFGLASLASATIVFALCRTLWLLVVARFLQGLATAVVVTVGYALIFDKIGSDQLGQAMGWTSLSLSAGWFIGPVVGGIIYKHAGYLAVFVPPLALVGIEIMLRLLIVEDERTTKITEQNSSGVGVFQGDTEATPLIGHDVTIGSKHRSVFITLLSSKRFVVGMFAFGVFNGLMVAFDGILPVFLKDAYGFNSQQVSLTFLAMTMPMLLSPIFGAASDRLNSTKWPATAGFALCVPGLLLLRLTGDSASREFALLIVLLVELGVAFAVGLPPLAAEVMHVVEDMERMDPGVFDPHGACSQAYGLTNAGFGVGCVLGPVGAGFIRVYWGWKVAVTAMAVVSGVTAVIVLFVTGGPLGIKTRGVLEREVHSGTEA
ncbi:uncharacterized protein PV09_04987 [Verruconis gallopava]|uniref:Major facilitator superfamily (MFS) profile domain-containing protein n=1 Tax=Verruconis gallopava TaxID=253628 RepID=A0A0D2AAQ0_9PEZI|nr:uncharacterized protein PV09_04987 [Verruconis gallopava]KIW03665.1 hypothetical protein PV09_04987 [Verruconis gallopava]